MKNTFLKKLRIFLAGMLCLAVFNTNAFCVMYSIWGYVTTSTGAAINGTILSVSGSSTTSNSSGSYNLILATGTYTITPAKTDYTFSPASSTVVVSTFTRLDFTGIYVPPTYTISGTVADSSATAISGVTMTLSGSTNTSTSTNGSGVYSFPGLLAGNYTVVPTKTNYTFAPSSRTYASLSSNQSSQNYTGTFTDATPPSNIATVNDGLGADIYATTSTTILSANWTGSIDAESGISAYWYAIGITQGGTQTVTWTNLGTATLVTRTSLTLSIGTTYYFSVYAVNGSGLHSSTTTSNGQYIAAIPPTTYSINGYVTDGSTTGIASVTVTLSGAGTGITTTAADGSYSFSSLSNGSYTVTPTKTNYTFVPVNIPVTVSGANQTSQNFVGTYIPPAVSTYTLTTIVSPANSGTIALNPAGGTYTAGAGVQVTATPNSGYTFASWSGDASGTTNPVTVVVDSNKSVTANFSVISSTPAPSTYSISGTVTSSGTALSGVAITLTGASSANTTTAADGTYSFSSLANGNYTVTPAKTNYTFSPVNIAVTISGADQANQNFIGTYVPPVVTQNFTISGYVRDASSNGINGVTVALSGSASNSVVTNWNGYFSFTVVSGGNYTVTPSKTGYKFAPSERSYNNLDADKANQHFNGIEIADLPLDIKGNVTVEQPKLIPTQGGRSKIKYTLGNKREIDTSRTVRVSIKIYNASGSLIKTVVDEDMPMGEHSALWDGKNFDEQITASGVYFVHIVAGDFKSTKKIVVIK